MHGRDVGRVDLAATGPASPVPPGLPPLPGPGEYVVSPALSALLRRLPADQLRDRYPGRQVGLIGAAALPSPASLVVVVGHAPAELAGRPDVVRVSRISTTVPSRCTGGCALGVGTTNGGMQLLLSVVAGALLFPVAVFVGSASRLAAARREQRFAALRLVGATPRQVARLATVESAVAAVVGVVAGTGLYLLCRPLLARVPLGGDPFQRADVAVSGPELLLVALAVPVVAAVVARVALRRVAASPLGVARRVTPRPPGVVRVLPLLAGLGWLAWLAYASDIGSSRDTGRQANAYLVGALLTMTGLLVAGPWLTMAASRLVARRARRPAALLAGRRLADDPRAGFRAVSGLVLAVFVGTATTAVLTTIAHRDAQGATGGPYSAATVMHDLRPEGAGATTAVVLPALPGVRGVALLRALPGTRYGPELVSCAELALAPAFGRCSPGATTARLDLDLGGGVVDRSRPLSTHTWPAADRPVAALAALPVERVVVMTDGTPATVERVRTALGLAEPRTFPPGTLAEYHARSQRDLARLRRLADVVLVAGVPIAGCSLAVGVAGGLADRRRPFSLLRLAGTPLALLRRVVVLEAAVPLVVTAALSAGTGVLSAHLFLRAQLQEPLQPLGSAYYALLAAGLVTGLLVVAAALPLLRATTGPEAARNG